MTNNATIGLFAGLLLAIAVAAGGFAGLLIAVILGGLGLALGAQRDGSVDLGALLRNRNRG